jgi:hypothetical protein
VAEAGCIGAMQNCVTAVLASVYCFSLAPAADFGILKPNFDISVKFDQSGTHALILGIYLGAIWPLKCILTLKSTDLEIRLRALDVGI